MGDYFKDIKPKQEKKKEELIDDFDDLCAAYNALANKIQEITTQGYESVLPIRTALSGSKTTPDDTGKIGKLRDRIRNSRIWRMEMGQMMYSTLDDIENLDRWSEMYFEYLEDCITGLKTVSKSGFKIIIGLHETIKNVNTENRRLKDQLLMHTQPMPGQFGEAPKPEKKPEAPKIPKRLEQVKLPVESPPEAPIPKDTPVESKGSALTKKEQKLLNAPVDDDFKTRLEERLGRYIEAEQSGDTKKIQFAKMQVFGMCGKSTVKRAYAEAEYA